MIPIVLMQGGAKIKQGKNKNGLVGMIDSWKVCQPHLIPRSTYASLVSSIFALVNSFCFLAPIVISSNMIMQGLWIPSSSSPSPQGPTFFLEQGEPKCMDKKIHKGECMLSFLVILVFFSLMYKKVSFKLILEFYASYPIPTILRASKLFSKP